MSMPEPQQPARDPDDVGANTEMFRAFTDRQDAPPPRAVGAPFRIVTLLVGLAAVAGAIWLLFRI